MNEKRMIKNNRVGDPKEYTENNVAASPAFVSGILDKPLSNKYILDCQASKADQSRIKIHNNGLVEILESGTYSFSTLRSNK